MRGGRDHDRMVVHWGKADDRNCNYGHPKMVDVECILNGTCIGTIVIYELITRKSQITTEKCI